VKVRAIANNTENGIDKNLGDGLIKKNIISIPRTISRARLSSKCFHISFGSSSA